MRRLKRMGIVDEPRKLITVTAITDADHVQGFWRGQFYEARVIPTANMLSVGDKPVAHVIPGNSELVVILPLGGIIYYGVPTELDLAGNCEAQLWSFDGANHRLIYTTILTSGLVEEAVAITCIFWLPATSTLYFVVFHSWYTDATYNTYREEVHLYKYTGGVVTDLGLSGSVDSQTEDWGDPALNYRFCPPINEAAWFKGKAYLGQGTSISPIPPFQARVYEFDPVGETLTRRFIDPHAPGGDNADTSLAVYGADDKLLWCGGYAADAIVYTSVNGLAFVPLVDLGFRVTNMISDPVTGRVWISYTDAIGPPSHIGEYDGVAINLIHTFSHINFNAGVMGRQYSGTTPNLLWLATTIFVVATNMAYWDMIGWTEENAGFGLLGITFYASQAFASLPQQNSICVMEHSALPAPHVKFHVRQAGAWVESKGYDYALPTISYGTFHAMCLARTAVLPHEQ